VKSNGYFEMRFMSDNGANAADTKGANGEFATSSFCHDDDGSMFAGKRQPSSLSNSSNCTAAADLSPAAGDEACYDGAGTANSAVPPRRRHSWSSSSPSSASLLSSNTVASGDGAGGDDDLDEELLKEIIHKRVTFARTEALRSSKRSCGRLNSSFIVVGNGLVDEDNPTKYESSIYHEASSQYPPAQHDRGECLDGSKADDPLGAASVVSREEQRQQRQWDVDVEASMESSEVESPPRTEPGAVRVFNSGSNTRLEPGCLTSSAPDGLVVSNEDGGATHSPTASSTGGDRDGSAGTFDDGAILCADAVLAVANPVVDAHPNEQPPSAVAVGFDPDAKLAYHYSTKRFRLYASLAFLVVVIVAVGASIGSTLGSRKNGQDQYIYATQRPATEREEVGIEDEITRAIGTDGLEESDVDSPYRKALRWIMNDDPMQLSSESANLIQRYIAAYFYFSTTADGPWESCNPEDAIHVQGVPSPVCNWLRCDLL